MIAFYVYDIILIAVIILFLLMSFRLKSGKYNIIWPVYILKYFLPIMCCTFYGHSLILLLSIFKCLSGRLYYTSKAPCQINILFYFNAPISIILLIFQTILSYITISMYYNADFIEEGKDILKKRTSIPDVIFLFCKIVILITFAFDKEKEYEHWAILFAICLISGLNVYGNLVLQSHKNIIIKKFHNFFSLFLFWGFLCLFISNIFKSWEFNGGLYLFFIGLILIIIYCLFYSKTYKEFLYLNFNEMSSSVDCLNYIKGYLNVIRQKESSRDISMILTSFIEKMEEKCTNKNCVLKKYLLSLSNGFDSNYLLFQYAEKLFKIAITKFSKDITLKIHYIIFLLTKINQKKQAQKVLSCLKSGFAFLDNNFKIFRCKKYVEEYNMTNNIGQEEGADTNDILQELEYKNNSKEFKKLLSKSSSLYYDFWSSLYSSHLQGNEDFKKLNDIGAELNEIIEKIEKTFEKLIENKNNDLALIKLYESYARNILNNKEKYEKYYNISSNLIMENKYENREKDFSNFDLNKLNETDEFMYLTISADDENKGTIINISLNACSVLGYHKQEIIGKNMNLLIPEIFHKRHNKIFNETTEKTKTRFYENLSNKIIYIPHFNEFSAFGRNKSRYLIPLFLKVFFVQTEDNELVYIVDFARTNKINYNSNINENDKDQLYIVLTDDNLIIQTFTSNCEEFLGFNTNIINSNYDITSFIKQFNDDFQSILTNKDFSDNETSDLRSNENSKDFNNNNNDKSVDKLKLKRKLIKIKYSHPRKIVWKMNNTNKNIESEINPASNKNNDINEKKIKSQKKIILEVKEAYISGKHVGYYFFFNNIKINENNNPNQKVVENKSPRNKSNLRRPSAKIFRFEEEQSKSVRLHNNDEDFSFSNNNNLKVSNDTKKKNSIVNFDLDNEYQERKNESSKILNDMCESNHLVGPKFIPKSVFNFILDLETMAFKPSSNINTSQELYNKLRFQSMEKLNIISKANNKKDNSSFSTNTENSSQKNGHNESDSDTSSESSSSDENNMSIINSIIQKQRKNQRKGSIIQSNILSQRNSHIYLKNTKQRTSDGLEEYYKVNLNKIKLMIYDFSQEMIVNKNDKEEKKSKMEIIIEKYKLKQNININDDSDYPNICFEKFLKETKDKNKKSTDNINKKRKSIQKNENTSLSIKEKDFEKEISYALSKKDEQKSIIFFYKISFLYFLIIILMNVYEIFFIISKYLKLKQNVELVINATNLKYFTNFGIYYIREAVLYNINYNITNGTYIIPGEAPDKYKETIENHAKNTFVDCNSILESILGSNFDFSNDTNYMLMEQNFTIDILYINNSTEKKQITATFFSSLIQVYSAFCNLLVKIESISNADPNLYNFIHNAYNKIGTLLNEQLQLLIHEMEIREKSIIKDIIICSCVYFVFHIIIYFIISTSYCSIVKKKASYIEVFYGIGLSLIKSSIKKCEIFINKINQDDDNTKINDIDDETNSFISLSKLDILTENNKKMNNNKKTKYTNKNRKLDGDKKSKKFRNITKLSLFLSFIYLLFIFLTYLLFITKFIFSGNYLLHLQTYHNNIIELFNSFREYLFDEDTIIYGSKAYDYLLKKEEDFYSSNTEIANYSVLLNGFIKALNKNYEVLEEKGLCGYYISYFNNKKECENYIGGKNGIMSLGFRVLINYFIEEIRNSRNYMKLLLDKGHLIGNLSEIYINSTDINLRVNETLKFRMTVFNLNETHSKLNIVFLNVLLQYIDQERNITVNTIYDSLINGHVKYIIMMFIYIFLFLIIFIFYWIPMIRRMNNEIYKTKNMLSIIPLHILAAQPNIKELLNINKNN